MALEFEVSNWKPFRKNTLRGFFTLTLPSGMILHNCSLHQKDNGQRWIGMPSQKFSKQDGSTGYTPLIEFVSREAADHFRDLALAAVDKAGGGR
jgi:hypothetical protein